MIEERTPVEVGCSGETHRIVIINALSGPKFEMLDHDEDMVRAFVAFDAKGPPCFELIRLLNESLDIIWALMSQIANGPWPDDDRLKVQDRLRGVVKAIAAGHLPGAYLAAEASRELARARAHAYGTPPPFGTFGMLLGTLVGNLEQAQNHVFFEFIHG